MYLTDTEWATALDRVREFGTDCGHSAATWVLDGNSSEADARRLLELIENCELDYQAPLSGEFADGLTAQDVADAAGVELDTASDIGDDLMLGELCDAFGDAYNIAYQNEAERSAKAMLS